MFKTLNLVFKFKIVKVLINVSPAFFIKPFFYYIKWTMVFKK